MTLYKESCLQLGPEMSEWLAKDGEGKGREEKDSFGNRKDRETECDPHCRS